MSIISKSLFFLVTVLSFTPALAETDFPINVDITELQEFDGIRNNSLIESTLIRPRFLIKHKHKNKNSGKSHQRKFDVKTIYLCESTDKCDSINLSLSKSERNSKQKIYPYFVGLPKQYSSIWVQYKIGKNKRKFKKLKLKSPIDFSNPYAYESFFDVKGHNVT